MGLPAIETLWVQYADGTKGQVADLVGLCQECAISAMLYQR